MPRQHPETRCGKSELWQVPRFAGLRHGFRPNVDCFHTDDPHALTVVVEVPGIDPGTLQEMTVRPFNGQDWEGQYPKGRGDYAR